MIRFNSPASAQSHMRRAGAFVFVAVVVGVLGLTTACDRPKAGAARSDEKGPRELQLSNDTLQIPDSIHVATIRIDRTKAAELEPATVTVRAGDLLRFISNDAGAHAIAFDGEGMGADARAFLEKSGQMRSPPFLAANATWVVSFKGAPAGKYPYRCPTHGVQGTITVTAR